MILSVPTAPTGQSAALKLSAVPKPLSALVAAVCLSAVLILPAQAENNLATAEPMELGKDYAHSFFHRIEDDDGWYYDSSHYYTFCPTVTDEYTIEVKGSWINENTWIEVTNQNGRDTGHGYYNEHLNRVTATTKLYSGQRYYIEVFAGGESNTLQKLTTSINKHHHEYEKNDYEKCTITGYCEGYIDTNNGGYTDWCKVCEHEEYITFPSPANLKLSKSKFVFNGKEQKPKVKITDVNGKVFTSYRVQYPKSKAVGQYQLKITFTGDYKGSIKVPYTIVPTKAGAPKLKAVKGGFSASWKKVGGASGYQVEWAEDSTFYWTDGRKIAKNTNFGIKNKYYKGTQVYFRIRAFKTAGGKRLYGAWSKSKSVKVK